MIRQLHQVKLSCFRSWTNTVISSIPVLQIALVFAFCSTAVSPNIKVFFANLCGKLFYLEYIMGKGALLFLTFFKLMFTSFKKNVHGLNTLYHLENKIRCHTQHFHLDWSHSDWSRVESYLTIITSRKVIIAGALNFEIAASPFKCN